MIDLHIHTTYSDGVKTVTEILKMAENKNLSMISITDHDTCDAYNELETIDVKKYFSKKIITGVELTTTYNNNRIELLAYEFNNHNKITSYIKNYLDIDYEQAVKNKRLNFINKIKLLGYRCDEEYINSIINDNYFEQKFYDNIVSNNPGFSEKFNINKKDFFRTEVCNPNSIFFIDYSNLRPKIHELVDLIHENGGLVFLAHPYLYKLNNLDQVIIDLKNNYNIDGIEVMHSSFNMDEVNHLINLAKEHNLCTSGGSDYHGEFRPEATVGLACNNTKSISSKIYNKNN